MPKTQCGLDHNKWEKLSAMFQRIFNSIKISITMYMPDKPKAEHAPVKELVSLEKLVKLDERPPQGS